LSFWTMERENTPLHNEQTSFERLDGFIDQHLDNSSYTLADLCGDLGVSRSQLSRLVKEHADLSPSLYIRRRRLLRAKILLESTDLRIVEISDKVGLDSPQTLAKYFSPEFGVSPTEYRKNNPLPPEPVETGEENRSPNLSADPVPVVPTTNRIPPDASRKARRGYLLAGLALLLVLVSGLAVYVVRVVRDSGSGSGPNAIAVLPFKNLGAAEKTLFADGLMGQVHASLTLVEGLKVVSKTSSMLFEGTQKPIPTIADELGVSYLLTGTVAQASDHIRISMELIQAQEDQTIWTTSYDGDARNAVKFMNDVAKTVAQKLNQKLSQSTTRQIDKLPTRNWDAYSAYLEGQKLMQSREKAKLEASIRKFDQAIALDTSFADAYAYRASAYFITTNFHFMDQSAGVKMAEQSALDAIRLDADNGTAYAVLAGAYKIQYKWEQALTTYQIALKHSPNNAQINYWYSLLLRTLGRFEEAIRYSAKAVDYDPLSAIILGGYINSCTYAGDFTQAKRAIDKGELMFDKDYMYFFARATYHLHKEEYEAAIREFEHSDVLSQYPKNGSGIAYCQAKLGRRELARQYLGTLAPTPDNYLPLATVYAGLGDKEACFGYLQKAANLGLLPDYFKISPVFAFLHDDPRYPELLRRFGLLDPLSF
jgi:adenylate cyclase